MRPDAGRRSARTWRALAASPTSPAGSARSWTSWPRSRRRRRPSPGSGRSRRRSGGRPQRTGTGGSGAWQGGPRPWRPGWTSGSCTTRSGTSSRSATTSPRAASTAPATTCWPPRSCLTSFLAIARGEVPRRHWFQLGRPFIRAAGRIGLVSWGGTMFEYLMPRLLLRGSPARSLAEACRAAVARQIEYGRQDGRPLGHLRVGLQRPVRRRRLPVPVVRRARPGAEARPGPRPGRRPVRDGAGRDDRPREAAARTSAAWPRRGARGAYGFYEAIDYTPDRRARGPALGRRPLVHGPPPGDEPGRAGQRRARRPDAPPVPRRADGPGRRAAPAGARAARRAARRAVGGRPRPPSRPAGRRSRPPLSRRLTTPAHARAADAPAVQRRSTRSW